MMGTYSGREEDVPSAGKNKEIFSKFKKYVNQEDLRAKRKVLYHL